MKMGEEAFFRPRVQWGSSPVWTEHVGEHAKYPGLSLLPTSHLLLALPTGRIQGSLRDKVMEVSFLGHRPENGFGEASHGLESQICCFLDVWSWARELPSLSLGFHVCKVGKMIVLFPPLLQNLKR